MRVHVLFMWIFKLVEIGLRSEEVAKWQGILFYLELKGLSYKK